jgi:hypothetical protein
MAGDDALVVDHHLQYLQAQEPWYLHDSPVQLLPWPEHLSLNTKLNTIHKSRSESAALT